MGKLCNYFHYVDLNKDKVVILGSTLLAGTPYRHTSTHNCLGSTLGVGETLK